MNTLTMLNDIKYSKKEIIKEAFLRNEKALMLRPSLGKKTAVTKIKLEEGVKCTIEDGSWKIVSDFNEKRGGGDEGPNPGMLGRGAFGACLIMGLVMWASKLEIDVKHVEVHIAADFDVRGEYNIDDVSPGYSIMNYSINITSSEPKDRIESLVNLVEKTSSFHDLFKNGTVLRREINLTTEGA